MKSASESEVKERLHEFLSEPDRQPVMITHEGAPAGILIPVGPGEALDSLVSRMSPGLRRILEASHAQVETGEHLSDSEFWKEVAAPRA